MRTTTVLGKILNTALSIKRPHGSQTNVKFTQWLREQLPLELNKAAFYDGAGNLHVDNRVSASHKTLFVAHVDTVHRNEGKNKIAKTKTHWRAKGDVLGADDGAGVALLFHMIHANVRGYYVFTQGEERGGVGARYLAEKQAQLLSEFDRAIAFDRRGIDSVITHQGWGRCCSDTFGTALADALMDGNDALMMLNDDTGVYTDTAEFTEIIPECTNISVGYAREHTQEESLDLLHYKQLSVAVLSVDWDALPVERDPSVVEPVYSSGNWWSEYTTYKTNTAYNDYTAYNDPDFRREDAIDAVLDAQCGYHDGLANLVAESVWPDDTGLALKHMNFKQLPPATLDWALESLEHGEDIDLVLNSLFDELHFA
jgi:hypothetical protein